MINSPAEGIKGIIEPYTDTITWDVEIDHLPPRPDRIIMIKDTGGATPNPKWSLDFPSVQIMVRGGTNDAKATRTICNTIKDLLLGRDPEDIDGDRWVSITMAGDIMSLARDENQRPLFSSNYRLIIEPLVTAESNRSAL